MPDPCWFCQGAREFYRLSRTPGIPVPVGRPLPCPECRAEEFKALYRSHGSQGEKGGDK